MASLFSGTDDLLRGRSPQDGAGAARGPRALPRLLLTVLLFGSLYGGVMGTFGGFRGDRPLQMLYSGLKVPLLLAVTFALSLPSFFVLNTILGVREDFSRVLHALVATQAGLTVILAALAPFTAFWYVSVAGYDAALLFNAAMFAFASVTAQFMLRRFYRPLIAANARHRTLMWMWLVVYAFVGIQMGWVLRPFIGNPNMPATFVRHEGWKGNAYELVATKAAKAMGL